MPTTFLKGDLFADTRGPDLHAIASAAECSGSMDQGVASAIGKRWPGFAEAFRGRTAEKAMQPGELFAWRAGNVFVYALGVFRGEEKPKLAAFTHAVEAMVARATADGVGRIGLARVGGLDATRVKRVLTDAGELLNERVHCGRLAAGVQLRQIRQATMVLIRNPDRSNAAPHRRLHHRPDTGVGEGIVVLGSCALSCAADSPTTGRSRVSLAPVLQHR